MASKGNRRGKRHRRLQRIREADALYPEDMSTIEYAFPDGWTIRRPLTLLDMQREGYPLKNCLVDPDFLVIYPGGRGIPFRHSKVREKRTVYSLRDPDNYPHLISCHSSETGITTMQGAASTEPKPQYVARLQEWLDSLDYEIHITEEDDEWRFYGL